MKSWVQLIGLAVAVAAGSATAEEGRPAPQTLRHREDHRYLRDAEVSPEMLDPIKDVVLDDDGEHYLSFGGTLRFRQDVLDEPFFGLRGEREDDFTSLRALLHADGHFTPYFRTFVEVGSMWAFGRSLPERPIDENRLSFQQAFVDLTPLGDDGPIDLTARVGRQTFGLGSARLVGIREGPNVRLSLDGVRVLLKSTPVDVQLLALGSPRLEPGAFDDRPSIDEGLFGAYATLNLIKPHLGADLYYLGYRNVGAAWSSRPGTPAEELRHSVGTRLFGRLGAYDYNVEAVVQSGTLEGPAAEMSILAWTVAIEQGVSFGQEGVAEMRVGLRANMASGDADPDDDTVGTFNALFPKQPYFSQLVLLAPSNLMDVHPHVTATWFDTVSTEIGVDVFWRHREADGLYRPPGVPLIEGFEGRYTGVQLNAQLSAQVTRQIELTLYGSRFQVSESFRGAGARDASFLGFWSTALL